ncbi:MAG TPA: energy transducer TonB [Terriglobia bacterium]|nr:energy transducer TonB [Terriglobia bacterium]
MSLLPIRVPPDQQGISRPVLVRDLWQDFPQNPFSWANSALIHLLALAAMVLPFALRQVLKPVPLPKTPLDLTRLVFKMPPLHGRDEETHGGGGGGAREPLPASRGALPPFARTQFTPPEVVIPKVAALTMPATLVGPPELTLPAMKLDMPWGDPQGLTGPLSQGPGVRGGIGDGTGTGVGPGGGGGAGPGAGGGCCGNVFTVGSGISEPIAIYSPEPAYSDEARKAKFQGIVLLWIVVDAQGNVRNVQVAKALGMGLDEEAVKTVSSWRFKPALRQGVPVPVQVQVEVSFRLF